MQARKRAILLMLLCASLWSIAGIFIKMIPWNSLVIAGWRSLLSCFCVAVYMRMRKLRFCLNRASFSAGIALSATFFFFVSANKLTTAANAIVLQFTAPVFILLFSAVFLRQRFLLADVVTVGITLAGISLFFLDQLAPGNLMGNMLGLCAGLSMAGMYIITGNTGEQGRMSGILLGHLFTAAIGLPFMLVYETPFTMPAVVSILILGIFQLGIPYVLYGIAVKDCPALACSLLGAVEPLLNPVWVLLFDGERPGIFALIGGGVVIATITVWCIYKDRVSKQLEQTAVQTD